MNEATESADSIADAIEDPAKCLRCGVPTQLNHGTCINCLLREGLEAKGEASRETFESILVEANVIDTQWRLGHYEILEEIGRGGMGVIYRARQQHSRRIVAVKRILAHQVDSHDTLVRFRREAEAVASLDHPNILPIHEVSESEEGLPFFSMKYATGGSLRTAAPTLRTKPRECVQVMAKVARAIAYAHGKAVLHRDLQPGNILLDENGEPMVSDFGLAKWLNETSDLTRTLETLGTPGYIAPEQAEYRAAELTRAADIYSLGAILFYILTGRPPFVGPNVLVVIHQAAATPAPRLRSLAPSVDRDLETIVARCLESDPAARYQSAAALADDLERWLQHAPIRARRVGVFTRGQKWVRRNPTTTVLVAALVALAAAIVGVLVWKTESPPPLSGGIAVLPFENLSKEKESAFFADGVQDDILTKLAKIADLKVIGRTSVMQYRGARNTRQIGNELGVSHVLEGSVRRDRGRVHLNAQLIDTRNGTHVWAEEYDRDLNDVFAIQAEIAQKIADQLRAKISAAERLAIERPPTTDLTAFDLYTRAINLASILWVANLLQATDLLNQAVARDPAFLQAYCQLAYTHARLYFNYDHTPARLSLAEAAVEAAFRVRPDAGEGHLAHAQTLFYGHLDYNSALAELALARQTLPHDPRVFELQGYIERRQGRWEDSARNLERASELDPRNPVILKGVGIGYKALRRYPEAKSMFDRVLVFEPNEVDAKIESAQVDFDWKADTRAFHQTIDSFRATNPDAVSHFADGWFICALAERDGDAATHALIAGGENPFIVDDAVTLNRSLVEALVAQMTKDDDKARSAFTAARAEQEKIVQAQPDYAPPLCVLGLIDAGLGRKEEALREGRRAAELLPVEKDALRGALMMKYLAMIAAWVGDKDLACEQLAATVRLSNPHVSYGQLKLLPFWDPLRGDPRFEKIVASLAPK
jgi:TolB-like protein/tRNA A-37 threonylcarbamoyl transferase component Bud32/Flp pilus assembly protein TadD